ncbi:MAG: hypothetical protein JO163_16030 [Methylobacteriaceae bacterium]|nr:hypothetical protein [Methylobacteriaceae bacterium]
MHKPLLTLAATGSLLAVWGAPAQAGNMRSWVASYGGGSTCTRSAPCATFAAAVAQTVSGGEINCVDQGDFSGGNPLTIDQSLTIDCQGVQARFGIAISSFPAIIINAGATDVVTLRGLDIDGNGVTAIGVAFSTGGALRVEECVIHDFAGTDGWGISIDSQAARAEISVSDTVLANNGAGSSGGGISVAPTVVADSITRVTLNRVEAHNNYFGIKADGTGFSATGGVINVTVRDSVASGNRSNGIVATGNASGPAIIMMVERSTSSQNATAGFGIIADGPKTTIALTGSAVMGNINGIGASNGGRLISLQDNKVILNSVNGNPTSVASSE